jgi:hypothetical protein
LSNYPRSSILSVPAISLPRYLFRHRLARCSPTTNWSFLAPTTLVTSFLLLPCHHCNTRSLWRHFLINWHTFVTLSVIVFQNMS